MIRLLLDACILSWWFWMAIMLGSLPGSIAADLTDTMRAFELNVTMAMVNPDCSDFQGMGVLVNNQIPGPAIRVRQGDLVQITVRNQLPPANDTGVKMHGEGPNDVSIHFHGIRQYGSSHADGVPFLTQYPIRPGESFVHQFRVVNQAGTFFYHAHVGLQEMTVFGPFIIEELPSPHTTDLLYYDEDRVVTLSEWWHRDRKEFEQYLLGPKFDFIPEADSILINGQTLHHPDEIHTTGCNGYETIDVEHGKVYRFRIIGATTFRTLGFAIANHNMTIIEVDGELVKPYSTSMLEVAPGQRFSVLVFARQGSGTNSGQYGIGTVRRWMDSSVNSTSNGIAVLRYTSTPVRQPDDRPLGRPIKPARVTGIVDRPSVAQSHPPLPTFPSVDTPMWLWPRLEPYHGVNPIVYQPASRTIKLRATDRRLEDGTVRWFINDVAFEAPHSPILSQIQTSQRRYSKKPVSANGYSPYLGTYPIEYYDIVDLVLQSTRMPGQPCRTHPWHTHGHSHWEIAYGSGEYNEARDGMIRNMPSPIHKDVTMVYSFDDDNQSSANNGTVTKGVKAIGCGWSKIRLVADNPGIWAVHCHNTAHMLMGMMVALEEAPELIPIKLESSSYNNSSYE